MRVAAALLSSFLLAAPLFALEPSKAGAEYEAMQKRLYSHPIPIPPGGLTITRDTTTWALTRGEIRLSQPSSDGRVTGFVFTGEGRFKMTIPDWVERAQLRRFTDRGNESFDEPFTEMVARFSDDTIGKLVPNAPAGEYTEDPIAVKRHNSWLVDFFDDPDARIIAAMLDPGALQITAAVKTAGFDWLTWDYDSSRQEEINVVHWGGRAPEIWISLDRPEDRNADGRPGSNPSQLVRLEHVDVKGDLTKHSRTAATVGRNWTVITDSHFVVTETLTPTSDGASALRFEMNPTAKDFAVRDDAGRPLTVFRDHIGKRSAQIDNRFYDDDVTVVLDRPLRKGEQRKLTFDYRLELANYAPGGGWYPAPPESFESPYTARLELTVDKHHSLRAMGRRESEQETDAGKTSVWIIDKPAKMVTFSTAERFEEVPVEVPGIPRIVAFGPDYQFSNTQKMHNVAADVANSLQYYQLMLDDKIGGDSTIYVTSIAGGHGQAFDGFLHLAESTFASEHPGASELFRAHEVAHEWWGHKIGWKTYRDQWLSEAFAEYSAMMFVQSQVKGGEKLFEQILESDEGIVYGDLRGGFSIFARPWLVELRAANRARVGPIGLGLRASTSDLPIGYVIQTYSKGPLVLHMLRQLLFFRTGKDDLFVKILRDFAKEYSGKAASTDDFRRVVENVVQSDFRFFFDAWINRAEIPSYTWSYKVEPNGAGYQITLDIKRSDVPEDFMALIPIRFDYEDGTSGMIFLPNKKSVQTLTQKVQKKPRAVVFAPDHSLLAKISRTR
jgi:hypothetical protein